MRVLWLCNIMLPAVAKALGKEVHNKEGWLTGLSEKLLEHKDENGIELGICFPVGKDANAMKGKLDGFSYYGFREDVVNPEIYDLSLEKELKNILEDFQPQVVHVFGTEYPHTLALTRCAEDKIKVVIGVQGICSQIAISYMANLPKGIQNRFLFRDFLKQDNIKQQQKKFELRGKNEIIAIQNVTNVIGRTDWDQEIISQMNPQARYFVLNETLRPIFYKKQWNLNKCERNSIFFSQANYPLKGFHYLLEAMPDIINAFPETKVYVAGDVITRYHSIYEKIKIGSYGKYCLSLIKKYGLADRIHFVGKLDDEAMCDQYLHCHLFLSASALENSPNSVGESMLLGMPVISSFVGGVPSMLQNGKEGILYPCEDTSKLADAVKLIFQNDDLAMQYGKEARKRALITHDPEANYERLLEIYTQLGRDK